MLIACTPVAVSQTTATATIATSTQTATITPSPTATPTATITPTATPLPDIGGVEYVGYWVKLVKRREGPWNLHLYYQNKYELVEIAEFCAHGGVVSTRVGFYFIAMMKDTVFARAPSGFNDVLQRHNGMYKIAMQHDNLYAHAADWNDQGEYGCPIKDSAGCVNMRSEDFILLVGGGEYTNPKTGKVSIIPEGAFSVGTPFVVVENKEVCTYVGECFKAFGCTSLRDCWEKYTCKLCYDSKDVSYSHIYYSYMLKETSFNLSVFDLPK